MRIKKPKKDLIKDKTYVSLKSKDNKSDVHLDLNEFGDILLEDIKDNNVSSVEFINQNEDPTLPPNTFNVNIQTNIAVDDNYLYVWVESIQRWKRIILSEW